MYNFLVTAKDGAWNLPAYEFERSRFGEFSSEAVMEKFGSLSVSVIDELKSFPTLFAYEGTSGDIRIGYIRRIKERGRSILIEYEFEKDIQPIPFAKLEPLRVSLDIRDWEMNRTHWAVKDEDLFEILSSVSLIDKSFCNSYGRSGRVEEIQFKVALSFSGDMRDYVQEVANELKKQLAPALVFYYEDFTAQLARPNLDTLLQRIYLNNSELVVVFFSSEYEKRQWCGLEWRAIREIIKNKSDASLMFMRFDETEIRGLYSIDGYVDLRNRTPLEAARFIVERARLNDIGKSNI
jgi:hypothetical protein